MLIRSNTFHIHPNFHAGSLKNLGWLKILSAGPLQSFVVDDPAQLPATANDGWRPLARRSLGLLSALALISIVAWRWGLGGPASTLRWRAPGACVEVYRVEIDEQFRGPEVAAQLGRPEAHERWLLALAGDPRIAGGVRAVLEPETPESSSTPWPSSASSSAPRFRTGWWSAREVGPAAPDLACRAASWDTYEDILATAWPVLPAHPVRRGDRWIGADVEGRCHETVCIDLDGPPSGGIRGPHTHTPIDTPTDPGPCVAEPMLEELTWIESDHGQVRARITGSWTDGRVGAKTGILTSRTVEWVAGRPRWAEQTVEQRWVGVTRYTRLEAVDECGGRSFFMFAVQRGARVQSGQIAAIRARLRAGPPLDPRPL